MIKKFGVFKIDESEYWELPEYKEEIKRIIGVYVYDPNFKVHCCEITPSYECHFYQTQVEFNENVSEEKQDEINCEIYLNEDLSETVHYYHCHLIDSSENSNCSNERISHYFVDLNLTFSMVKDIINQENTSKNKEERHLQYRELIYDAFIDMAKEYANSYGI